MVFISQIILSPAPLCMCPYRICNVATHPAVWAWRFVFHSCSARIRDAFSLPCERLIYCFRHCSEVHLGATFPAGPGTFPIDFVQLVTRRGFFSFFEFLVALVSPLFFIWPPSPGSFEIHANSRLLPLCNGARRIVLCLRSSPMLAFFHHHPALFAPQDGYGKACAILRQISSEFS